MLKWFVVFFLLFAPALHAEDDGLDLDFTNAPVTRILGTIAQLAGKNLVLEQALNTSMSLHVTHMNWEQALNLVLSGQNLTLRTEGDTWFISDNQSALSAVQLQKSTFSANPNIPLKTILIPLHYANGNDLITLLNHDSNLLGQQGKVAWDSRTNTLVATATSSQIQSLQAVVAALDVPVKQIHIETRIVVVDKSALQAFGIQLDDGASNALNTLGSAGGTSLNMGIPNPAGTLGFGIGRIFGTELNLQLQALELAGDGKVISAPELTVSNNQEASIQQGSEVPFQTSTSSGATQIEYISATLGLKVTPELTPNGEINMILQVNKNAVSGERGPAGNMPIINTSQVNTEVLVQNGQTIVLGGIYSEQRQHSVKSVPVLGGIPGIGWLFRNNQDSEKYTDLLIFVTPTVVEK